MFAESADNYTDIVYIENGIIKRALIRSTLKRIEDMNTAPYIIRVHRAFLVNLRKVKEAVGNSQGFRLVFDNIDETVPVARRSSSQVKDLLAQIHRS
ncbi:MAG: LytTR family transcriptional regulator DNA-binding domain-containing protein [Bacteroidetes bacterium]|nr:LytTR family transcriptional regulator DNA-binding domain-containing protein [Bacteroidota bacterium]